MKYFVTGATGFVGGVLVKKLREAGHEVNASVRSLEQAKNLQTLGVKVFKGDVTDKESMREPMTGSDGVYHVAGWYKYGQKDSSLADKINIQGTRNVLELMQELKIAKGVYTSTLAINSDTNGTLADENYRFVGKHISEYDRTKAAAHDLANEFIQQGLPLVIVQPGLIYGPGDTSTVRKNLIDLLNGKLPMLPTQTGYCWAHIDDVVEGHILAMQRGKVGESYIICGEPCTAIDAFALAAKTANVHAPMTVPHQILKILSVLVAPVSKLMPPTYTPEGLRIVGGTTHYGDNSKAKRELGYNPRSIKEGWVETVKQEMKALKLGGV
jgi:nucleoside-diphosphate-sugar epimerase